MRQDGGGTCRLEVRGLAKHYPGTVALHGLTLGFKAGRVHALLGKNGAGKSTLVKILAGAQQPTAGEVLLDGRPVALRTPAAAMAHGIATVYQELSLVPQLSVAENILFGRLPRRGIVIDWLRVYQQAAELLQTLGIDLDVRRPVYRLGVAAQQLVEIAKAMSLQPGVLLLDEPTSALAHHEAANLFRLIRQLAAQGVAIIYISHRLQELHEVTDTMSVLRDGELAGTIPMAQATPAIIADMMFGGAVTHGRPAARTGSEEAVLEVRHLARAGVLHDINFTLRRGEMLGIAGMLGAGRTELLMSLFGAQPLDAGEIVIAGRAVHHPTPARMKSLGVALAPEDRKRQGLVQQHSVEANLALASLRRGARRGVVSRRRQSAMAQHWVNALHIKAGNLARPVALLSGGNQQKVVIGKWLNTQPRILLFDEPTRGIDVQAKQQIFAIVRNLSEEGVSSVFVSSELEELMDVCHRILIMRAGRVVGEVTPATTTLNELLALCMEE